VIKRADDDSDVVPKGETPLHDRKGKKSVIVRMYDALGGKCSGQLCFSSKLPVSKAYRCNLLEDDLTEVEIDAEEGCVPLTVKAFEVVTIRLELS
jgi:alpha-mannosidase